MSKLTDAGKASAAVLKTIMAPQIGREDICDSIGYATGIVAPSGVVTPAFIGQWYGNIVNPIAVDFYRAIGPANTDWVFTGDFGLGALDPIAAGTVTASKAVAVDANKSIGDFGNINVLGAGGIATNQALGSTALDANTTGARNTAVGIGALSAITTSDDATAVGHNALLVNTATGNTALGSAALDANIAGVRNTAVGFDAGGAQAAATDNDNTFVGHNAGLLANGSASGSNTALGSKALDAIVTGIDATAIGKDALGASTASGNVAVGARALDANVAGLRNVAVGVDAGGASAGANDNDNVFVGHNAGLLANGSASGGNTIVGSTAFNAGTTAVSCTAVGFNALGADVTGNAATAIGKDALAANTAAGNTAVGANSLDANVAGVRNVAVGQDSGGAQAGANDNDNVWIGHNAGLLANGSASGGNTAVGSLALDALVTGIDATAVGISALSASTASGNVALGARALDVSVAAVRNVAVGVDAGGALAGANDNDNVFVGHNAGLLSNGSASGGNTAVGSKALDALVTGIDATAVGFNALTASTATGNVAVGARCLDANVAGTRNVAMGVDAGGAQAGANDNDNVFIGNTAGLLANGSASGGNVAVGSAALAALTTGINNVAVGLNAGTVTTSGEDNVFLGNNIAGAAGATGEQFVIGHDVTGIASTLVVGTAGDNVNIDWKVGGGGAWTVVSDVRGKNILGQSSLGLDFISRINPIEYTLKPASEWPTEWEQPKESHEIDTATVIVGVSAQQVKAAMQVCNETAWGGWTVGPDGRQRIGHSLFVYPLINAVNELSAQVAALQKQVAELSK